MPTYDYRCENCGQFQVTQRITEPALKSCPTCGGPVTRLISRNVAIIFKGPGFYCTDNRKTSVSEGFDSHKPAEASAADAGDKNKAEAKAKS
jgi:putative FmdB family regulatory protein